jgi:hypothetical protein
LICYWFTGIARITSIFATLLVVPFGGSIEIHCDGVGPPVPDIYWSKESLRLNNVSQGKLTIRNATFRDAGVYSCHASNYLGRAERRTKIVVIKLEFVIRPPSRVNASLAQTIFLDCAVRAAPGLEWLPHWSFPLCSKPSDRRKVLSNGTLVIPQATEHDSGLYHCQAQFGKEKISTTVSLAVPRGDDCGFIYIAYLINCLGFWCSRHQLDVD